MQLAPDNGSQKACQAEFYRIFEKNLLVVILGPFIGCLKFLFVMNKYECVRGLPEFNKQIEFEVGPKKLIGPFIAFFEVLSSCLGILVHNNW